MIDPPAVGEAAPLRLFFALWPGGETLRRIGTAADALLSSNPAVQPVSPLNHHLTVAFVGAVAPASLERVRRVGAAQRAPTCTLEFDAYEYWPKPEVVVAAARVVPRALAALWESLHHDLAAEGFVLRPKRLRPHVTLARQVSATPVLPELPRFSWQPAQFCLARSDAAGADPVYTVLDTWPLLYDGVNS